MTARGLMQRAVIAALITDIIIITAVTVSIAPYAAVNCLLAVVKSDIKRNEKYQAISLDKNGK